MSLSMVKLSKSPKKLVVRVKIEDEDSKWHVVTMFNSTLEKVIDAVSYTHLTLPTNREV